MIWFKYQYSDISRLCFSVPNGGERLKTEARILNAEGVKAGVSDVILLIPRGKYSSLCIEFKSEAGKQTDFQKSWQELAEKHGNKYVVCRSFEEFRDQVQSYLSQRN